MGRLSDYDYVLPERLIAQTPLEDRAASRLLVLDKVTGKVRHLHFRDCADILQEGDLLVMNDTRVTARRLLGTKLTGGNAEALILRETAPLVWEALVKPGKRLQIGAEIHFPGGLEARVVEVLEEGLRSLKFNRDPSAEGQTPLPPYIHTVLENSERYQTVYSKHGGSSAAPTAGLHFTHDVIAELERKGVKTATVTLDVGLDTFRPVQSDSIEDHKMHGEKCRVPEETVEFIANAKGRIVAVGTTAVRTLESMAEGSRRVRAGEMTTTAFITPGYRFKVVDGMFTNFHLPRTTMLMMLSAMVEREHLMTAYSEAIAEEYRFLSFGDSMLII